MDRRFLVILAAIVVIFAGIFVVSQGSGGNDSNSTNSSGQPTSHIKGQGSKGVTFLEYGDYQCPVCAVYEQPLEEAINQVSSDVYFQFRNLPLSPNPHPNAFAAARAAEAAALQDKFWEMHDKIYARQNDWASASNAQSIFEGYAKDLGLNLDKFKQDYASSKVNDLINADVAAFNKTGRDKATPTFFLDGQYISNEKLIDSSGSPSAEKIVQVLKDEIAKKNPSANQ